MPRIGRLRVGTRGRWMAAGASVAGGVLENDGITNGSAQYRIVRYRPAGSRWRWRFDDNGSYAFDATGAVDGESYEVDYEVDSWDGSAGPVIATVVGDVSSS